MKEVSAVAEISETKNIEAGNYRKIKPEGDITPAESRSFIKGLFEADSRNAESKESIKAYYNETVGDAKVYRDDNGVIYRKGNELVPDCKYEKNTYTYRTDSEGRIKSAGGMLHIKEHDGRMLITDSLHDIGKGDEREGDDRGHIIGDQFGGSNGLENMIPQDADINRKDFKQFEGMLAKEVKDGKNVKVRVEPRYDGASHRPTELVVTYTIDGDTSIRIFPNERRTD